MPTNPETGTRLATIAKATSGATFDGKPARNTHGGARNRADRTSDGLTLKQCERIFAAAYSARNNGKAFNRFVTIHWEQAGILDSRGAWATGRFIKLASDWLRPKGERLSWAWVRENGDDKGSHVHILMHVAPDLARAFGARQRSWLKRITGRTYARGNIKTKRIAGTLRAAATMPELYAANLDEVLGYMLKGASRQAAQGLRLTRQEEGGRVIGKRAACSHGGEFVARVEGILEARGEITPRTQPKDFPARVGSFARAEGYGLS